MLCFFAYLTWSVTPYLKYVSDRSILNYSERIIELSAIKEWLETLSFSPCTLVDLILFVISIKIFCQWNWDYRQHILRDLGKTLHGQLWHWMNVQDKIILTVILHSGIVQRNNIRFPTLCWIEYSESCHTKLFTYYFHIVQL